eukprot:5867320-Prymnesium_polylepis.2
MIAPPSALQYNVTSRQLTTRKVLPVPGYDPSLYGTDRILCPSRDGKEAIPVTLFYRRDLCEQDGSLVPSPLHLCERPDSTRAYATPSTAPTQACQFKQSQACRIEPIESAHRRFSVLCTKFPFLCVVSASNPSCACAVLRDSWQTATAPMASAPVPPLIPHDSPLQIAASALRLPTCAEVARWAITNGTRSRASTSPRPTRLSTSWIVPTTSSRLVSPRRAISAARAPPPAVCWLAVWSTWRRRSFVRRWLACPLSMR